MGLKCPSENELIGLISDDLSDPKVRYHVDRCEECQQKIGALVHMLSAILDSPDSFVDSDIDSDEKTELFMHRLRSSTSVEVASKKTLKDNNNAFRYGVLLACVVVIAVASIWRLQLDPPNNVAVNDLRKQTAAQILLDADLYTSITPASQIDNVTFETTAPIQITSGCWHPKITGRLAIGCSNGDVRILQLNNGDLDVVAIYYGGEDIVNSVGWSPDGQFLAAGSYDGIVRIWSDADQNNCTILDYQENTIRALGFSPDNLKFFSMDASGLVVFRSVDGFEIFRKYQVPSNQNHEPDVLKTAPVSHAATAKWAPNSRRVFVLGGDYGDYCVAVSIVGPEEDFVVQDHSATPDDSKENAISDVTFSEELNSYAITYRLQPKVEIRSLTDLAKLNWVARLPEAGISARFNQDASIRVQMSDEMLDVDTDQRITVVSKTITNRVPFVEDSTGTFLLSKKEYDVSILGNQGALLLQLDSARSNAFVGAVNFQGHIVSTDAGNQLRQWNSQGIHQRVLYSGVQSAPVANDSETFFAVGSLLGELCIFDANFELVAQVDLQKSIVSIAWLTDDQVAVGTRDSDIYWYKLSDTDPVELSLLVNQQIETRLMKLARLTASDLLVATCEKQKHSRIFRLNAGGRVEEIVSRYDIEVDGVTREAPIVASRVLDMQAFDDDSFIVSAHYGSSAIWNGDEVYPSTAHGLHRHVNDLDIHERSAVTAGGSGRLLLWDQQGNAQQLPTHTRLAFNKVRFSPDGKLLAAGDHSGKVWLFDMGTEPRLRQILKGNVSGVVEILWLSNGSLAVVDRGGVLRTWNSEFQPIAATMIYDNAVVELPMEQAPNSAKPHPDLVIKVEKAGSLSLLPLPGL